MDLLEVLALAGEQQCRRAVEAIIGRRRTFCVRCFCGGWRGGWWLLGFASGWRSPCVLGEGEEWSVARDLPLCKLLEASVPLCSSPLLLASPLCAIGAVRRASD